MTHDLPSIAFFSKGHASDIIQLIHENKCITKSKSSTDDDTNKWKVVKSRRNEANKHTSDLESVGVMNKLQLLFIHEKEQSIGHNSSTSNDPIDFSITNSKKNEHNIEQKGRPSLVINLYPKRDVLMHHTNNIATGKPNAPQTIPANSAKYVLLVIVILTEPKKTYLTSP